MWIQDRLAHNPMRNVSGSMGIWSFYFLAKLGLFLAGLLSFIWWANLAFALALAVPVSHRRLRPWRQVLAVLLGVALLWFEASWMPPAAALEALSQGGSGVLLLVWDRARDSMSGRVAGYLVLGALAWYAINRRVRLGVLALLGILMVPLIQSCDRSGPMAATVEDHIPLMYHGPRQELVRLDR